MISVITPSIRKDRLEIVAKSLQKQTNEEWEWLIGSPFDPKIPWAKWIKDDFVGGFWSLNRIYNKLIENARGDLIVSWQDSIYTPPTSLDAFWEDFQSTDGVALISAVGDQYDKLDNFGKPHNKVWVDPRKTNKYGSFYETNADNIEWNFCAIPKKALETVGGFDEGLDFLGFGLDSYQVNERLDESGYKLYLNQEIESYSLRHNRDDYGGEDSWNQHNMMQGNKYQKRKQELIEKKQWPIITNKLLTTS